MKVAVISTNLYSIPPKGVTYAAGEFQGGYGGESQVYNLVKGLCKKGVHVEQFCTPGSKAPELGQLHYLPQGDWFSIWDRENRVISLYEKELKDCDLWHDWSLSKKLHDYAYTDFGKKALMTCWGTGAPGYRRYNAVLWSAFQRGLFLKQGFPESTPFVWGSVDPSDFEPNYEVGEGEGEGYFLYLSRVHPSKRTDLVVNLAKRMGFRLMVAADTESPDHLQYLQELQRGIVGCDNIQVVPDPTFRQKLQIYRKARALILPSLMECFGLVVLEAMASGTPAILADDGAFPEIVEEGKTGFLCRTERDYINAVNNVGTLDRKACRRVVETKFNHERMAQEYISIYSRVASGETF